MPSSPPWRQKVLFGLGACFLLLMALIGQLQQVTPSKALEAAEKDPPLRPNVGQHLVTPENGIVPTPAHRQLGEDGTDQNSIPEWSLMNQTDEQAMAKSKGCLRCHNGIEKMHASGKVRLGCVDCHGGDPEAHTKECAHVLPRYPEKWPTSATPQETYALLNQESAEWVRFINPGDHRIAHLGCGTAGCHPRIVDINHKTIMSHTSMVPQTGLYNNGAVPNKIARWGEVYGTDGTAQRVFSDPRPTLEDVYYKGVVPFLDPLPNWRISQPNFRFRIFEINNNATSLRGPGTDARVDVVFVNLVKTKLNDPTMAFLGGCNNPGDYRSSGCTACHVLYANDREPGHSAQIAEFGNRGYSFSGDPTIPKDEVGHPIKHQLTRQIPTSQCMTCHYHQGSGALANYIGYVWWDYESDAEAMYPITGRPKPGGIMGEKFDLARHDTAPMVNPTLKGNKFADFHNNTWYYQAVYKRDVRGNMLDAEDNIVSDDDPDWHKKAVHLRDIHMELGLHCIDCHFQQDVHGTGQLFSSIIDPIEINCKDCHGTVYEKATLITSNAIGGNDLRQGRTPFGERRFSERDGKIYQRSMVYEDVEWEVVQTRDTINPESKYYNEMSHVAKTLRKDGMTWGDMPTKEQEEEIDPILAHQNSEMTCYACHSSWNTSCGGCHLSGHTNVRAPNNHYEGEESAFLAYYNPQALRADTFILGVNGTVQRNRVSPARAASGVIASAHDGNRACVVHQRQTVSAEGFAGHAFTTNPPHTVTKGKLTKQCTDCHVSAAGDNNTKISQVLGLGVHSYDFVGRYAFIADSKKGLAAVQVTSSADFPNPVLGSNFHRILEPEDYKSHVVDNKRELKVARKHHSRNARSVICMHEWVFVADGPGGFKVYDIANVHNKDVANKIVSSGISPLGQSQNVKTKMAMWIDVASINPVDPSRPQRPENEEQTVPMFYRYGYLADFYEGLILIDVLPLFDGIPDNNEIERKYTFNPEGKLSGAVHVKMNGDHAYVLTKNNGIFVVYVADPECMKIVGHIPPPAVNDPKSITFQFRYAFVADKDGLKVVDITYPHLPSVVALVPLRDARDVWMQKTYAYVANGRDGLAIINMDSPERPGEVIMYNADGRINDASGVVTGSEHSSFFAFVADGKNGLRVIELLNPADGSQVRGFSPKPIPRLVATYSDVGCAVSIARGMPRERAVDIDGNQIGVFGRRGGRPFNRQELRRMYIRDGLLYTVTDSPPSVPLYKTQQPEIAAPILEPKRLSEAVPALNSKN